MADIVLYWSIPALTNHSKERLKDKYPSQKSMKLLDSK